MDQFPLPEYDKSGGRAIITSWWGPRWGSVHRGVDIGTSDGIEIGVPVYPVVPGTIVKVGTDPGVGAGNNVWLMGDDGTRWKYFHLNRWLIDSGHVGLDDVIAEVGMSGTGAPHLHLEKHEGGWSNSVNFNAEIKAIYDAGRFPGSTPPPPPPPPSKDWFEMATEADLERAVRRVIGVPDGKSWSEVDGQWHKDDRAIITGASFQDGLRSRPYTFTLGGQPQQWILLPDGEGNLRRWPVTSQDQRQALIDVGFIAPDLIEVTDAGRVASLEAIPVSG